MSTDARCLMDERFSVALAASVSGCFVPGSPTQHIEFNVRTEFQTWHPAFINL